MTDSAKSSCCGGCGGEKHKPEASTSRHLDGAVQLINIEKQIQEMKQEDAFLKGNRNSRTLVKFPDFRVVLVLMKKDCHIHEHQVDGKALIQCMDGHIQLNLKKNEVLDLKKNLVLSLDGNIAHDVTALEDSAFLLSITSL